MSKHPPQAAAAQPIALTGTLICQPADRAMVEALLPEHLRLTREEPEYLLFQIVADRCDPCRFFVAERFTDQAAFAAHQVRSKASAWGRATTHLHRAFQITGMPQSGPPQSGPLQSGLPETGPP